MKYVSSKVTGTLVLHLAWALKPIHLVNGKNIPLVILPDVAWYGEKAYFDNGELGYQWLNQPKFSVETYLQLDRESALFSVLHPANILIPNASASNSITSPATSEGSDSVADSILPDESLSPVFPENQKQDNSLSIDDVASRKWAINGGIRGALLFT